MKIRPLHDRILVKRLEEETKTSGGLFIPDSAKEKPIQAKIVAVGTGKRDKDGKVIAPEVKAGDRVLFSKYSGTEVQDRRRRAPDHARGRHPRRPRLIPGSPLSPPHHVSPAPAPPLLSSRARRRFASSLHQGPHNGCQRNHLLVGRLATRSPRASTCSPTPSRSPWDRAPQTS